MKRLRQLFAEKPEFAIPEMRLLTEDDWLRVAKNARFDTGKNTRLALAEMRATAIRQFQSRLSPALAAYNQAFPNQKPASVQALAAYFAAPIDPAILDRYELQDPSGPSGFGPSKWFVQNQAPIDFAYDSRFRISTESAFQNMAAPPGSPTTTTAIAARHRTMPSPTPASAPPTSPMPSRSSFRPSRPTLPRS